MFFCSLANGSLVNIYMRIIILIEGYNILYLLHMTPHLVIFYTTSTIRSVQETLI